MNRKVILYGDLADKFGEVHRVSGSTLRDALQVIDCNHPGFADYFRVNKDINFSVKIAEEDTEEKDLLLPIGEGDIVITPLPSGAGGDDDRGIKKVVTGLAILAALFLIPGSAVNLGGGGSIFASASSQGGFALFAATTAASIGVNLALTGIQELLAPDPATDNEQDESYLFTGADQKLIRGVAVPVLYGELRVPGIPISFSTTTNKFYTSNSFVDTRGNIYLI